MEELSQQRGAKSALSMATATYCVFRRGSRWLAFPTTTVREIMPRPEMVDVPGTPGSFFGLCHVRSEFIPVLNLESVLPESDHANVSVMLIVDDTDTPWAILVDEVTTLRALEISDAPAADILNTSCVVVGWATFGSNVVQVLDPCRIRNRAEQELAMMWQSSDHLPRKIQPPETTHRTPVKRPAEISTHTRRNP